MKKTLGKLGLVALVAGIIGAGYVGLTKTTSAVLGAILAVIA